MKRSAFYVVLVTFALGFSSAWAQYGGYGGEFLRYGVGGRAMAMGGAYVGLAEGASAMFFNPAGLSQVDRLQLSYMNAALFADTRYRYLALVHPFYDVLSVGDKIVVGLGRVSLGTSGLEARDRDTHRMMGEFSDEQAAWIVPVVYDHVGEGGKLAIAFELNRVSHSIAEYSASGLGYGFSLLYQPMNPPLLSLLDGVQLPLIGQPFSLENLMKWRVGLLYRSLPSLRLYKETENLPDLLRAGLSFTSPVFGDKAWFAYSLEMGWFGESPQRTVMGAEIGTSLWKGIFGSLRLGKRFGHYGQNRGLTFGVGLESMDVGANFAPFVGRFSLDYVHDSHTVLGGVDGFFITLKLFDRHEDVSRLQLTQSSKLPPQALRRILSWHPRDRRRVGFDSSAVFVDSKYRDGADSGDSTGVAELLLLSAEAKGHERTANRYDDFIGGFKRLLARTLPCMSEWRKSIGKESGCLESLAKDWRRKEKKLAKRHNADALKVYLQYLTAAGQKKHGLEVVAGVAKENAKLSPAERRVYEGLFKGDVSIIESAVPQVQDPALRTYLRFLCAALSRNVDSLRSIAVSASAQTYGFGSYLPAPLLGDGMIVDDAMLLADLFDDGKSPEDIRRDFLHLLLHYPNSDAAMLLSLHAEQLGSGEGIQQVVQELRQYFAERLAPGRVVTWVQ